MIRVANAKAAIVPGGIRKDVLHVLTDFVVVNDRPFMNPPRQVPLDTPQIQRYSLNISAFCNIRKDSVPMYNIKYKKYFLLYG